MNPFVVVSFTFDLESERRSIGLIESAARFGLVIDVAKLNRRPTRAEFVREKLDEHAGADLFYVEADGVFRRRPTLVQEEGSDFDVAAYVYRPGSGAPRVDRFDGVGWILPWTLFVRQSDASRKVLDRWIEQNVARPDRPEAQNLLYFLASEPVRFRYLPETYAWVERVMRGISRLARPIIEHRAEEIGGAPDTLGPEVHPPVKVRMFAGLGDTFYARPALRALSRRGVPVYAVTSWPQLVTDLPNVKAIKPDGIPFRIQRANVAAAPALMWSQTPKGQIDDILLEYGHGDFKAGRTPVESFLACAEIDESPRSGDFAFPVPPGWVPEWVAGLRRPVGVIHAPTVRREWRNTSRNPQVEHLQRIVDAAPWMTWVSVGWESESNEWRDGPPLRGITRACDRGELSTEALVGLVAAADVALAGPCFLLPLAAAVGTPVFVVFGGSVPPDRLIDPLMGDRIGHVAPEPFCACLQDEHDCRKTVEPDRLVRTWNGFRSRHRPLVREVTLNVLQGIGDIFWVYQKFAPYVDRLRFKIMWIDGQNPVLASRALPFVRALPKVVSAEMFTSAERYAAVERLRVPISGILDQMYNRGDQAFDYSCNAALEDGVRLEAIDPDYAVEETVQLERSRADVPFLDWLTVYVSGLSENQDWINEGTVWTVQSWARFVELVRGRLDFALPVVIIGASYDRGVSTNLETLLRARGIETAICTDLQPGEVFDILGRGRLFLGYQSGLNVLADNLGSPQIMLYSPKLRKMARSWPKWTSIERGLYQFGFFSESPEEVAGRISIKRLIRATVS
ncbi:MAG: hypothetical protein ACREDF_08265 [Thermoplasmata archaeon]